MEFGRTLYKIFLYLLTVVILAASLYAAMRYVTSDRDWGEYIEWNCWESVTLYSILCIMGFFLQFFTDGFSLFCCWRIIKFDDIYF